MLKIGIQRSLFTVAAAFMVFLSATPTSAEMDLESRIQALEQELEMMREELQGQLKPAQDLATKSKKKGFSTLPGWSAGYRYDLNADDKAGTKIRLFVKRKSLAGNSIKLAWTRQTGHIPNFFKTGTIDGDSLDNWGSIYIEQEFKF